MSGRPRTALALVVAAAVWVAVLPAVSTASHNPRGIDPCAGAPAAEAFVDRDGARPVHVPSIDCAAHRLITLGSTDSDGQQVYLPLERVTRGQMASFIARTLIAGGYDEDLPDGTGADEFGDVAATVHREAINRLARADIVRGTSAGVYSPEAPVTRQQMAAFVVRAARFALNDEHPIERDGEDRFLDVADSNVHQDDIEAGADTVPALFRGVSRSSFDPASTVLRDQMATFLANLLRLIFRDPQAQPAEPSPGPTASPTPTESPMPSASPIPSASPTPSASPGSGGGGGGGGTPSPSPSPSASTRAAVPDVVGMPQGRAMTTVLDAAFTVGQVSFTRSSTVPAGRVLVQDPKAGTRTTTGAPVDLEVSLGAEALTVPDVVGMDEKAAKDRVEKAGFALGRVTDTSSDEIAAGDVASQLPRAGQEALPGTPVDVDIARGTVNDPPSITSAPSTTHTTGGTAYGYTATATDPDGDALTWSLQSAPAGVTLDSGTGALQWSPDGSAAGPHDLVVRVDDGRGGIDTQSWTLAVSVPNRAPVAVDDALTATAGQPRAIGLAELLGNDSDPDGDAVALRDFTQPRTGRVTGDANGLVYTPNDPTSPDRVLTDVELTRVQPATVTSSAETQAVYPIERLTDDSTQADWFATSSTRAPVTLAFAFGVDVVLRRVDLFGSRQFGERGYDVRKLTIRALDAAGGVVFEAAELVPDADATSGDGADADTSFDLVPLNAGAPVPGVRRVEVVLTEVGDKQYPGLAEIDLHGDAPAALLAPRLAWEVTDVAAQTVPLVADLDGDGNPEVVHNTLSGELRAREGATGAPVWARDDATKYGTPAIGDLSDDPGLETAYVGDDSSFLRIASATGGLVGEFDTPLALADSNLTLADVDGDGQPEIIAGGSDRTGVFDVDPATGVISQRWIDSFGCARNDPYNYCTPVVVDIDVDGQLEVVRGHRITDAATGRSENGSPTGARGFVAVANFDDDAEGEIVSVTNGSLMIRNHDLTPLWGPVRLAVDTDAPSNTGYGGLPTVADFDGDGRPEVGVAGSRVYAVYDPDVVLDADDATEDSVLWKSKINDTTSSSTGSTVFDFQGDGAAEVVYADQEFLRVYDGATGAVLWSRPNGSNTRSEAPVVADVDGDGEAEIVVTSERSTTVSGSTYAAGLRVFASPDGNWVRTRGIWNQHAYDVTNVESDGSIPAVPKVNWLTSGLNSFRQQHLPLDDPDRLDVFTYSVTDGNGLSATATAAVDVVPVENDPNITCGPPAVATVGFPFTGRICVDDPDGDPVTFAAELDCTITARPNGNDNPWLAGMPVGTTLSGDDVLAPGDPQWKRNVDRYKEPDGNEAPEEVLFPCGLVPGQVLEFEASGSSQYSGPPPTSPTDGRGLYNHPCNFQIASVSAPLDALIGVFLSDDQPGDPATSACDGSAGAGLDFSTEEARDYRTLPPKAQQPFFIGDGVATDGVRHQVQVPEGATRLFLGSMDGFGWWNNTGGFDVAITTAAASESFTIDPAVGTFDWRPTKPGVYELVVLVTDSTGRQTRRTYPMRVVAPATVPGVVGLSSQDATDELAAADLAVGSVERRSSATVPDGEVLEQFPGAGAVAEPGSPVHLVVSSGPSQADTDADGDGTTPNQGDCKDSDESIHPGADEVDNDGVDQNCDGEDGGLNIIRVGITGADSALMVGRTRSFQAAAQLADGRIISITDLATYDVSPDSSASISGRTITALAPGAIEVTATFAGQTATKRLTVIAEVVDDVVAPVAEIVSPLPGDEVATTLTVTGTATDANLTGWALTVVDDKGVQLAEVARGTGPVANGEFGSIAAAALPPGLVNVRLDVEDSGGNVSRMEVPVLVDEGPQVGAFELLFTDTAVPLPGLSLSVSRRYDSRDGRVGDFGAGWDLDISGMDVSTTPDQGLGWELQAGRFSTALAPTAEHSVSITLPDGQVEVFDLIPSPRQATFVPLSFTRVAYVPRSGTRGRLRATGNTNLLVLPPNVGDVELVDDTTLQPYEPAGFVYTTIEGVAYTVDAEGNVERVTDRNGNTITVTDNGVEHSAGRSVTWTRDALDRITTLTDADGNVQTYTYDARGDLVAHKDPEDNTTRFRYIDGHKLVGIDDPLGRAVSRLDYDDEGRLVSATDAEGRVREIDHDPGSQTEVMRNPDGTQRIVRYDVDGNVTSEEDELGRETTRTFDPFDRMTSETNPAGETTRYAYDAVGNELERTDDLGNVIRFSYDAFGELTSSTDANGHTTRYTRDAAGNLLSVQDPEGNVTSYSYDDAGNRVTSTDANGHTTRTEHDQYGNATAVTLPDGTRVTADHDPRGLLSSTSMQVEGEAVDVSFTYDRNGRNTALVNGEGETTTFEYDATGKRVAVVGPDGGRTETTYANDGQVASTTLPTGGSVAMTYDSQGKLETQTELTGGARGFAHDAAGQLTTILEPDPATGLPDPASARALDYDAAGRPVTLGTPGGAGSESLAFDDAGRLTQVVNETGETLTRTYDAAGRVATETDALGRTTSFTRDDNGRVVRIDHPDGTSTTTTYDAAGNVLTETDEAGRTTAFTYDERDQLVAVVDAAGVRTAYERNELGALTAVVDGLGRTTRYEYDSRGLLTAITLPGGQREERSYNARGHLVEIADANGGTTSVTRDTAGRPLTMTFSDGTTRAYTWDEGGNATSIVDARGTTSLVYDERGRVTSRTEPDGTTTSYGYGTDDAITSMVTPGGTTTYDTDAGKRMTAVTDGTGTTTFDYDGAGRLTTTTLPNGVVERRSYDQRDRLLTIAAAGPAGPVTDLTHTYTSTGKLATVVDAVAGTTTTYGYDAVDRVTREHVTGGGQPDREVTFTYDAVGNRLSVADSVEGTQSATYDENDRLVERTDLGGTTRQAYDSNGNLLARVGPAGQTVFGWTADDRLAATVSSSGAGPEVVSRHTYDESGLLVQSDVAGAVTRFLYDRTLPFAAVVDEYRPDGTVVAHSTLGGPGRLARTTDTTVFLHGDHLDSVRATTDAAGARVAAASYSAYGSPRGDDLGLPFGFTGEPQTADGLVYLRNRWMDPATGRFLSADLAGGSSGTPASLHDYVYAHADPVNLTDPSGLAVSMTELAVAFMITTTLVAITFASVSYVQPGKRITWEGPTFDLGLGAGNWSVGFGFTGLDAKNNGYRTQGVQFLVKLGFDILTHVRERGGRGAGGLRELNALTDVVSLGPVDIGLGGAELSAPALFGGLNGIDPTLPLTGPYLQVGASFSTGLYGSLMRKAIGLGGPNTWSPNVQIQGFAYGGSWDDSGDSNSPGIGIGMTAGISIDITPAMLVNQKLP